MVDRASGIVANGSDHATVTVTVLDSGGAPIVGAVVALAVDASGGLLVQPGRTDTHGIASGTLASTVAGTFEITATATMSAGSTVLSQKPSVSFVAGPASALVFGVQPSSVAAGAPISPAVQVLLEDANGNVATSSTATVSVSMDSNSAGARLTGTTQVDPTGGVATFTDLRLDKAGTGYTLVASASGLSATSAAFDVVPGAPARLAFVGQPTPSTAGAAISPAVKVAIEDAEGNLISDAAGTVTMALGEHAGATTLSGTIGVRAVGGVATFSDLSIGQAGAGYLLQASANGLASVTSAPFDVAPAAPMRLAFANEPVSVVAGETLTPAVRLVVEDAFGNAVPSATVAVSLALGANAAGGTLSGTTTTTTADGVATFSNLSIDKAGGAYDLVATAAGLASATSLGFAVSAGVAAQLVFLVQPSSVQAGAAIAPAVKVAVEDALGNSTSGNVALNLGTNPGGATLSGTRSMPALGGVATFSNLTLDRSGRGYTFVATAGSAREESVAFDVAAGAPAGLSLSASTSSATADGTSTIALTATVRDALGNPVPGEAVTLSASGDADVVTQPSPTNDQGQTSGTISSTKAGLKLVVASAGSATASTAVTFVAGPPTLQTSSLVANPTVVYANDLALSKLTLTLHDAYGNPVAGQSVSLASSDWQSCQCPPLDTLAPRSGVTRGDGTFVATLRSGKVGAKTVTATAGEVVLTATVTFFTPRCDGTTFFGDVSMAVGANPISVATGDLNGDSHLDVVVVNRGGTVSVLLGNGNGTFQPQTTLAAGGEPMSVATGDFNGDGFVDLAVANSTDATVSVLLGRGDGTFAPETAYAAGHYPRSVTTGDFNGDGLVDLAVANSGDNTVGVLVGRGDGTFAPQVAFATGRVPDSVKAGDFNRDGKADLVVANAQDDTVSVLIGNGDATFAAQVPYSVSSYSISAVDGHANAVTTSDFNHDGKTDLAVAKVDNTVAVLLGRGDGTFGVQRTYDTGDEVLADNVDIATADVNRDAVPDLLVANDLNGAVSVLLGHGDGTFAARTSYVSGAYPVAVATGDFDGDHLVDLVVANFDYSAVRILMGDADGTLGAETTVRVGDPISVAAGDFNTDQKADLALGLSGSSFDTNVVPVLLGNGNDSFGAHTDYDAGGEWESVLTTDVNGDGNTDLVVADLANSVVRVRLGDGTGTFGAEAIYGTGKDPVRAVSGDFNGDGLVDLAVANSGDNTVSVLLGKGNGTFKPRTTFATGNTPGSMTAGDFNGDGKADLAVVTSGSYTVSVFLGDGSRTLSAPTSYSAGAGPVSVANADFNGDGLLDLVVADEDSDSLSVLLGQGDGTFGAATRYSTGSAGTAGGPTWVTAADFNGDGHPDLVVAKEHGDTWSVILGNGDGTFGPQTFYSEGAGALWITTTDFNGDGRPDLAMASYNDTAVKTYLQRCISP